MKAYPVYKDSRLEWIGDIPADWDSTRIKFLANGEQVSFIDGDWIESPYITDDGIRLVQTGNVGIGVYKEQGYRFVSEETFQELNCTEVFPKDVLICRLASPVGRACLAPELGVRMITSVDNCILKPSKFHDPRFIVYQLSNNRYLDYIEYISRGSTRARISRSMLGDLGFVAPPLPEQQAIADFLDRKTSQIDALIEKKQRQIDLLQEQRTALINYTVTKGLNPDVHMKDSGVEWLGEIPSHWIVSKLKYVCYVSDGNHGEEYPEETDFTDEANGVPFIRVTEFEGFDITRNGILYITKEKNESMRKGGLQENDILFVNRGSIGKMALVSKEFEGANLNSQIAYFRVTSPKMNYKYLLYFLYSGTFQKMISSLIHGGALQQLPLKRIIGLEVLCPPLEDQIEIVNYLEKITTKADLSIKSISKEIELVQEYRTALISEAVTGKIDVRTAV